MDDDQRRNPECQGSRILRLYCTYYLLHAGLELYSLWHKFVLMQSRSNILTHLAACGHQTAVTHCLPCEVFLCQPVPEHPVCSACTHRHIIITEMTF